jgi:ectoine hydroxylase-related dioxygenase (phytanoyl-CoA dioxygenase family)
MVTPVTLLAATSTYRRDGYVVIRTVLDRDSVAAAVVHLHELQAGAALTGPVVMVPFERDRFLANLVVDRRLATIAGSLLGTEPIAFGCTYFVKEPRYGLPVRWHQDGYPWQTQLGIVAAVTLWIALDAADESNGGLRVIPGSQHLAAQPLQPSPDGPSVFGAQIDPGLVDCTLARPLRLSPGDVSAHHPNLIHGSGPNRSQRPRRALAIRYRPG